MYLAWRYGGGINPFNLYHCLGPDGVPWAGGAPVRPARPDRVRSLLYGFGEQAAEEAIELAKAMAGRGGG